MVHVYPVKEEEQHTYDGYCICGGRVEIEEESGDMIYIHVPFNTSNTKTREKET